MIKILFLAANPKDTDPLRIGEEVREIKERLLATKYRDHFIVEQEWAVRVTDLDLYLLRHQPHIVHFSGHGSTGGEIILEDENGFSKPVAPDKLKNLFTLLKNNIYCVVLNACFSKIQAEAIAESIECVLGMSTSISDGGAIKFAAKFYQALGFDQNIQTAFDLGCQAIESPTLDEFNTPKLITLRGVDPKTICPIQILFKTIHPKYLIPYYLKSIITKYKEWGKKYTLVEATHDIDTRFKDMVVGECKMKEHHLFDAIKYHNPVIVIGEPGIGKTTNIIKSVLDLASHAQKHLNKEKGHTNYLPVLIILRERYFSSEGEGENRIVNMINDSISVMNYRLGEIGFKALWETYELNFVFLFDGLDEILDSLDSTVNSDRDSLIFTLISFIEKYKMRNKFMLSTRKRYYYSKLAYDGVLELKKLDLLSGQLKKFIERYTDKNTAEIIFNEMDKRLKTLAQNPRFLWLMIKYYLEHEVFMRSLARLIDAYVRKMLSPDFGENSPALNDTYDYLTTLAFEIVDKESQGLMVDKRKANEIRNSLIEGKQVDTLPNLEKLETCHILMIGERDHKINFNEQFIQDFFAARRIAQIWNDCWQTSKDKMLKFIKDNSWHDSFTLSAGFFKIVEDKDELYKLKLLINYTKKYDIILAGKLIGNADF